MYIYYIHIYTMYIYYIILYCVEGTEAKQSVCCFGLFFQAVCNSTSEDSITIEMLQGKEEAVRTEIFSSVLAEIRDEVS